jgi:hypothetical protein
MRSSLLLVGVLLAAGVTYAAPRAVHRQSRAARRTHPAPVSRPVAVPGRTSPAKKTPAKPKATVLAGRVLLPDGTPAAGAHVSFGWVMVHQGEARFKTVKTDESGRFHHALQLSTAHVAVTALAPDQGFSRRFLPVKSRGLASLELKLEPTATVSGRVVKLDGSPAPEVPVRVTSLPLGQQIFLVNPPAAGPATAPSAPAAPVELQQEQAYWQTYGRVLSDQMARSLYGAKTDAEGRFTLTGLPRVGQMTLALGGGYILGPGSLGPVELGTAERQDIGALAAGRPGLLKVQLTDERTRRAGSNVSMLVTLADGDRSILVQSNGCSPYLELSTDENGLARSEELLPGDYWVLVHGIRRKVTVEADRITGPVEITTRLGSLHGRVLDAAGKPVPRVPITLEMPGRLSGPGAEAILFQGWQGGPVTETAENGRFEIPSFDWNSPSVTIRAARGNTLAEWTGPPEKVGDLLELRLRPGAMTTVTGRLVDPHRKPVRSTSFATIRWQDAPRLLWMRNPVQGTTDPEGRFRVTVLPGESFSIIGQSCNINEDGEPVTFETPRFLTSEKGGAQDLGNVVVHTVEGAAQIFQLYGLDSPEQLSQFSSLLPPPSPAMTAEARKALDRYNAALRAADMETVHRMTSRASAAWAEDRRAFLQTGTFQPCGTAETKPLRFVPRYIVTGLLASGQGQSFEGLLNLGAIVRELDKNPNWVFLAESDGKQVRLASILHLEEGEWRVLPAVNPGGGGALPIASITGTATNPDKLTRLVPAPEVLTREAARAAGERFLNAWSQGEDKVLLELTSSSGLGFSRGGNARTLRRALAQRPDEGLCPVRDGARVTLEPIQDLTVAELESLVSFATLRRQFGGFFFAVGCGPDSGETVSEYVKRGDLLPFQYRTGGKEFLMLLLRDNGKWQVLEPALPF